MPMPKAIVAPTITPPFWRNSSWWRDRTGDFAQAQIFGPEIMAPLRDAMGLIDREKVDLGASEQRDHVVAHEALGGDIEQAQRPIAHRRRDAPAFVGVGSRIQRRRRN